MANKVPLTVRGAQKLRDELNELRNVQRPRIIEAIKEARGHGDLRENAEYHAAKEQQSFIEGRIAEIEDKLANAQVIDVTQLKPEGRVVFGATVTVYDEVADVEVAYQIVGEDEADIKHGLLSVNSPIARALIGKEEGEEVVVDTPGGHRAYEILQVEYK